MSEELFEKEATNWAVITIHHKQSKAEMAAKKPKEISHHELIFNGKVQLKKKGDGGLSTLRDMAAFMNKRGMVPKDKVQCLADVGLSPLPRKKATAPESEPAQP